MQVASFLGGSPAQLAQYVFADREKVRRQTLMCQPPQSLHRLRTSISICYLRCPKQSLSRSRSCHTDAATAVIAPSRQRRPCNSTSSPHIRQRRRRSSPSHTRAGSLPALRRTRAMPNCYSTRRTSIVLRAPAQQPLAIMSATYLRVIRSVAPGRQDRRYLSPTGWLLH
jgi:hypothetical protein